MLFMTETILSIKLHCMYEKFRCKKFSWNETEERETELPMIFLDGDEQAGS